MPHSIAIIINKNARRFRLESTLISQINLMAYARARVYVTSSLPELDQVTSQLASNPVDVVLLCGGDGTYSAGVSSLNHAFSKIDMPVVSLIGGGTFCTLARNIGYPISSPIVDQINKTLHWIHQHKALPIIKHPTLSIASTTAADKIGFIFGSGLVASFFNEYESISKTPFAHLEPTPKKAALIAMKVFLESFYKGAFAQKILEPFCSTIVIDEHTIPWQASSLILVSVVKNLGLGMHVTYRAGEDRLRPHVIVSGLPPQELGPRMTRVLRGISIARSTQEPHFDNLAQNMNIVFQEDLAPCVVDGELFFAKNVTVTAGPILQLLNRQGKKNHEIYTNKFKKEAMRIS